MIRHLLFFSSLLLSFKLSAQQEKLDSLNKVINTAKHDTSIALAYVGLTEILYVENIDTMIPLCNKALDIINKNKQKKLTAKEIHSFLSIEAAAYNNIGYTYMMKAENMKALDFFRKCLGIQEKLKEDEQIKSAYINLGIVSKRMGDINAALNYYHNALRISEQMKSDVSISKCLNNIGVIYYEQKNNIKAVEFFIKAKTIQEKSNDIMGLGHTFHNLGNAYDKERNDSLALFYFTRSLELFKKIKDDYGIAMAMNGIGLKYMDIGDDKALDYFSETVKLYEKIGDRHGLAYVFGDIAKYYVKKADLEKAELYGLKALQLAKEIGYPVNIKDASEFLSDIYKKQKHFEKALEMKELFIVMNDSVYNDDNKRNLLQKEYQYEYAKKAATDSVKVVEEKKVVAAQLQQERTQRFALYGGLALVLLFAGFMFNRFKISQKQKHIIEVQKEIVDEKQKEITDSINYSKRIQSAILPNLSEIQQNLKDSFILYKPKDIVSGDFYYYNKIDNNIFIAAADCTGHGVPGAFMSLVGSKELKIANSITDSPAEILKYLNNGVKDTLKQNHIDGTKDGMDIALVRINETIITYAAANRPLWIIKKGSADIEEVKATKHAIAGFTEDNFEYEEHAITLEKGDSFYVFSDGYADQFGGDKNKKLTTKRFKDYLLQIKDKPMSEQQTDLEAFVNSWKGNTEQVDDILVIGVKL